LNVAQKAYETVLTLAQEHSTWNYFKGHILLKTMNAVACGYASRGLGRRQAAWQYAQLAMKTVISSDWQHPDIGNLLLGSVVLTSLLLVDQGELELAAELYALALRLPLARSLWYEDVAGKAIKAAIAVLPNDVRQAAETRGRARDWQATAKELLEGN